MVKAIEFFDWVHPILDAAATVAFGIAALFLFKSIVRRWNAPIFLIGIGCIVSSTAGFIWFVLTLHTSWHITLISAEMRGTLYITAHVLAVLQIILFPVAYFLLALENEESPPNPR